MVDVAVLVGQDLHLDVLGLHQELFNKDVVVAEGLFGLALHQLKGGLDLLRGVAAPHAPAAAPGSRLQDDGEAVADRLLQSLVGVLQGFGAARDDGHAAGDGRGFGRQLVAHLGEHLGGRAHEGDARLIAGPGEVGVFGQKAVAGVNRVHPPAAGQVDDTRDIQISAQRALIFADQIGLVRLGAEQAVGVLVGVHGHRVQPQVVAGPENADGNLAAVGGQNFVERAYCHRRSILSISDSTCELKCARPGDRQNSCVPLYFQKQLLQVFLIKLANKSLACAHIKIGQCAQGG